jgi:hypothetical protein
MSIGERPRRRWRIEAYVEGDTWESAGQAFSKVLHILMSGNPAEITEDQPFKSQMQLSTAGLRLEISTDPAMTPEAYAETVAAWKAAEAELHSEP